MKLILLLFITGLFNASALGQPVKKFATRTGQINFISNAQLELIKASSSQLEGILDPNTNQFAFRVEVKSFEGFNSSLQREHFNEKYLETEAIPTASFSGKIIEHIDLLKNGSHEVRAKGDLEIHGQKQTRIIKSKLNIQDGVLSIEANFLIPLSDHEISVPRLVNQKIATEIEVSIKATLTQPE